MKPIGVMTVALLVVSTVGGAAPDAPDRRMSFHNRLLLNRAVLAGLESIEVMVMAGAAAGSEAAFRSDDVVGLATRLGGQVKRKDQATGYLRVEVPTERILDMVNSPAVAAYQIASFSKASWYRDGPPVSNAEMHRGFEVSPVAVREAATSDPKKLPGLTVAESRAAGYTLEEDAGVGDWMKEHPAFDGRGVTIALVENALPNFADPAFRTAKTLDGRDVPKIAGILNAITPPGPDETRVSLDTHVTARTAWTRVGRRTFVFPRPGKYRFGTLVLPGGGNVIHEFGVAEDPQSNEVWIDSNGDASFADEKPLADINERFDPRFLKVTHPSKVDVSFVMGRSHQPHTVHIYAGKGGHQSMTMSVAAGNLTDESLAYGVAPRARVLLVRSREQDYALHGILEAFIETARRTDVDVISASAGIKIITDTEGDFTGIFFDRLGSVYRKPILNSAGNNHLELGSSSAFGNSWAVGGVLGPATFATLHGGRPLGGTFVHFTGAAGPSLDGAIKPDFLAPMERLAIGLPWQHDLSAVPKNAPTRRVPPGYAISCCTSATSPYAAGVVALLISAAKQTNTPYSMETLDRALRFSSKFLPGFQSHEQGNGALDIAAAWQALRNPIDPPRIVASAGIVHPLAQYAARGHEGKGIFEFDGWTAGVSGTRQIRLRRESGPDGPITYSVNLSGNDGTFETNQTVTLPLGETVALPIKIRPVTAGAHSALLNLVDRTSKATVFRTQATIVAAERFDATSGSLHVRGTVEFMRAKAHHFNVPSGTNAISIELDVIRGVVKPSIRPAHGMFPGYYLHVHPMSIRFVGKGRHTVVLPNPESGTWTVDLMNTSAAVQYGEADIVPRDDSDAEYAMTVRLLGASVGTRTMSADTVALELRNTGSSIREPIVEAAPARLRRHRGSFYKTGLPNVVEITVPEGAGTLSVKLRSEQPAKTAVELFLYDCTTGECFSYDLGFPAGPSHTMVVRKPNPGRWVTAVNAAPFPAASGSFVLEEIITSGETVRRALNGPREAGARWTESMALEAAAFGSPRDPEKIVYLELQDAALERDERENLWIVGPNPRKLRDRPVAVGTAIYRR